MSIPQPKMLGKNGFKYKPKFGVIVICKDEQHQAKIFSALKASGHKCRVVTV
ncbi:MAG: hypothetical protein HRU05_02080 [Oceanospirillaceae bacterium]|nr:hypothetical protein [Oceanospirillaceae bacterium]